LADNNEVRVPDIGNAKNVDVIEILVQVGDSISPEQSIVTLESDKASMEIPAPCAGVVKELRIKVGDKVSEGDLILILQASAEQPAKETESASQAKPTQSSQKSAQQETVTIKVPDIGAAKDAEVIDVLVKPGDKIAKEQSLITLEGEKATMEIPSPMEGTVQEVLIQVGNKASQGTPILHLIIDSEAKPLDKSSQPTAKPEQVASKAQQSKPVQQPEKTVAQGLVHAGPAVRRIAREFGVDLAQVSASGPKQRILKEDVQNHVKQALANGGGGSKMGLPEAPVVDFSQFGPTESKPLSKIKRLTGKNLHRNWLIVPHITQFDEADITELEAFRTAEKTSAEKRGLKLTPLIFIMKAVVAALRAFPQFNASLDASGESLILKQYFHIGVAVDTPNGLVVPVIRDVDKKSIYELAQELTTISQKAREKGLSVSDMQGGCFSISSLGGIGGTAFTPIVNLPEVAILGVSKAAMKPVYQDGQFVPRLMLPLSLSYDHRVIDGADGARFTTYLAHLLADIRRVLL
jgi:pyruvate dehydrogenase E2 component (dihydrolipoamide acetyltransferase)